MGASRRAFLGGVGALAGLAVAAPRGASASYAPSSAAVTSTPPQKALRLDELNTLSGAKAKQREGALGAPSIDQILRELEASVGELNSRTQDLENQILKAGSLKLGSPEEPEVPGALKELKELVDAERDRRELLLEEVRRERERYVAQLEQQRAFQNELKKRAIVLKKLDAQPDWVNYAAAALASMVSTSVMHPVDTIKTKMQLKGAADDLAQAAYDEEFLARKADNAIKIDLTPPGVAAAKKEHTGLAAVAEELGSLYKGLSGNLVKEAPSSALYLGVYEVVKTALLATTFGAAQPLLVYLAAGGVGELCGSIIRIPAEACKTMTQSGMATSVADAVGQIATDDDKRDQVIFAWSSSLWRDVPMGAIQIAIFEGLKTFILQSPDIVFDVNTLQAEAALGALVTTPTDLITTRIITDEDGELRGRSVLALGKDIVDENGSFALFDGSAQRVLYWAPAIGIFLSCYCSIRQYVAFNFDF